MLYISVDEIKYGTVGATFKVTFSVPIDELPRLRELHDKCAELNMKSFSLTATKADTPQTESLEQFRVDLEYHTDATHFGKAKGESTTTDTADTPQTKQKIAEFQKMLGIEIDPDRINTDCGWK